jgi:chromosome segregation ATPase
VEFIPTFSSVEKDPAQFHKRNSLNAGHFGESSSGMGSELPLKVLKGVVMQNENISSTNIPLTEVKDTQSEIRKMAQEVRRLQECIDRVSQAARHAGNETERHERQIRSHRYQTRGLLVLAVLLTIALAGAAWYGYPEWKAQGKQLAELLDVKGVVAAARDQIGSLEEKFSSLTADHDKLAGRLTSVEKVEKTLNAGVERIRFESRQLVSQAEQRIGAEVNRKFDTLQSQVSELASGREADHARLNALQNDLARERTEATNMKEQTDVQIADLHRETSRNFSDVNRRSAANREDLDALTNRIGHFRVNFELNAGHSEELFSGIRLMVSDTNVGQQHLDGWLQLVKDGRTLWVRNKGIDEPLTFYAGDNDRPYQVVFTRVLNHSVAGYLLVPNEPEAHVAAAGE